MKGDDAMSARKVDGKLNIIGKNIAKYRLERNWSQAGLARELNLLGLPMHKNDIQSIEAYKRTVRACELWFLAKVFEITMEDFFIGVEDELKFLV